VAADFATVSLSVYEEELSAVSQPKGADLYMKFCATCHGADGRGGGPGTAELAQGGPAHFPANMGLKYILWRTWRGVPDTLMYPFSALIFTGGLTQADLWDVSAYVDSLTKSSPDAGGNR
jgi:cytochrome c